MSDPNWQDRQGERRSPMRPELARRLVEVYCRLRPYYCEDLQNQAEGAMAIENNGRPRPPRS